MRYKSADELSKQEMYDILISLGISEETLNTILNINGHNKETFLNILYERFGLRDFDQLED